MIQKYYPDNFEDLAVILFKLAQLLYDSDGKSTGITYYETAAELFKKCYGLKSPKLIKPLFLMGDA